MKLALVVHTLPALHTRNETAKPGYNPSCCVQSHTDKSSRKELIRPRRSPKRKVDLGVSIIGPVFDQCRDQRHDPQINSSVTHDSDSLKSN